MDEDDGTIMVYRYTWIAGAAGVALALARLNRLVRPSVEGMPWQVLLLMAAMLGGVVTWTALTYRLRTGVVAAVSAGAVALLAFRVATPEHTWLVLPTWDAVEVLGGELSYAGEIIRSGSAPVLPSAGLVVILSAIFWALGSLLVFGLRQGRPFLALVPSLAVYLYLATVDRIGLRLPWLVALLVLIAGSLAAVTHDERTTNTGRLATATRVGLVGAIPAWSATVVAGVTLVALLATTALASTVPPTGVVEWRYQRGLSGDYYGGVSYNPFVNVQKSLINPSNTPLFVASTDGEVAGDDLYWKLLTLDTFNGAWWYAGNPQIDVPSDGPFERRGFRFAGPTTEVTQDITILALSMDWLPAAYAPTAVEAPERQVNQGIRVAEDASLRFGSLSFEGMNYRVTSQVPQPDLAALVLDEEGAPIGAFEEAIADGAFQAPEPTDLQVRDQPPDADTLLELPADMSPEITELAVSITRGLSSPYERALALETYLRSEVNGFRYDTTVSPAGGTDDLETWLLDTTHPDYRSGYCEQYASALGVMGRAVGIPSRVVLGFTPGDDIGEGRVVVRDNNAHAWVEFWMPTQGWVRFDATPRSDGVNASAASALPFDIEAYLERPPTPEFDITNLPLLPPQLALDDPERLLGVGGDTEADPVSVSLPSWLSNGVVIAVLAVLLVGAPPAVKAIRRRRRLRRLRSGDVTAAWQEIVGQLSDLGAGPLPGQTPREYAAATHTTLVPLAEVYGEAIYGSRLPSAARVAAAGDAFEHAERSIGARYAPRRRWAARYRIPLRRRRRSS